MDDSLPWAGAHRRRLPASTRPGAGGVMGTLDTRTGCAVRVPQTAALGAVGDKGTVSASRARGRRQDGTERAVV